MSDSQQVRGLQQEIAALRRQLEEATDTLRAIRKGEVDAIVVENPEGPRVYTLETADHPYRIMVEQR
jgi:two-component system phosphate regulon sensor histidine kinase PhoR